ncbi:uncharacterized protein LOC127858080 [Dreissena polymorpha]|uniref:uncharacterized protein LOC127858080 n=1 Tax=Dreissena polymorpha TaxID=45954 RepID=UPI002263E38B|nr:uncharacterized protein LOC127858080 [Dreissena polymorpha]XP_052250927.1 uncharacterized protein LOC127858080 [Dreissena polymorpha]
MKMDWKYIFIIMLPFVLSNTCDWKGGISTCGKWTTCSQNCGLGNRCRECKCKWYGSYNECETCRNVLQCSIWRTGDCCETCKNVSIPHCVNGQQECGGIPDGIKCTKCIDTYYAAGYNNGCLECNNIPQCNNRSCTNATNVVCHECVEGDVIFKTWNDKKECQRMCAWRNHYCWPGTCGTSGLTKNCQCIGGFVKLYVEDYSSVYAGETKCQLNTTPDILICDMEAIGPSDGKNQTRSTSATTTCKFLADMYGNYRPMTMVFNMTAEFAVDVTEFNAIRPSFVKEEKFGITDTSVKVKLQNLTGLYLENSTRILLDGTSVSLYLPSVHSDTGVINVNDTAYNLQNGEALCLEFEAKGGGYLKSSDTRSSASTPSETVPYTKVTKQRIICYRYDDVPPVHCLDLRSCNYEPLKIQNRVTRSRIVTINFIGWTDPIPSKGNHKTASTIASYEITVHGVYASNQSLKVNHTDSFFHRTVSANVTTIKFNLTSDLPTLYTVYLNVHDRAGNVRTARRFVLYDYTSLIGKSNESLMYFKTANPETGSKWQNTTNVCLTWGNYFVNEVHMRNNFLNAIESDPRFKITGVYEQTTGLLPVSGTPNVNGIVSFFVSRSVGGGNFTPPVVVKNFTQQQFCEKVNLPDGQETIWRIQAVDIAGNKLSDERSLIFDASPPTVSIIRLHFNQYEVEYVQSLIELRKLKLNVTATDEQSGIYAINVGVTDGASYRNIVHWISNEVECSATPHCYCVQSGQCQMSFHVLQLDEIDGIRNLPIDTGEDMCSGQCELHVTVVNQAGSSTVQIYHFKIDITAPETSNAKIDIITENSSPNSSAARLEWSGFKDQESSILFYRVYLNDQCLTTYNMLDSNTTSYVELNVSTSTTEVSRDYAGKRYVIVVAFNGALTASQPVCSEGIEGVVPLQSNADKNKTAVTVGTSVGVILAILIISIAVYVMVRKYRSKTHESCDDHLSHPSTDISNEGVSNATYGEVFGDWNSNHYSNISPNPGIYELARNPLSEVLCEYQETSLFVQLLLICLVYAFSSPKINMFIKIK